MLELIEGALNNVALFVELFSVSSLDFAVALGRDDGFGSHFSADKSHDGIAVVSFVGQHGFGFLPIEQSDGLGAIRRLTAGKPLSLPRNLQTENLCRLAWISLRYKALSG